MRKLLVMTVGAVVVVGSVIAQETSRASSLGGAARVPSFEVASVKVNRSGAAGHNMRLQPGGRVTITNAPLRALILTAYGLLPNQLAGGPGWLDSERFDIEAQTSEHLPPSPPGGPPGPAQLMLQQLLADRFALTVRSEKRELEIYALTVARDGRLGPRMSPAKVDCAALMDAYGRGAGPLPPRSECGITGAPGRITARGASMPMLARAVLATAVNRVVEDRTGLIGSFDLDLEYATEPAASAESSSGRDGASIFTALEEQLGLKLRPVRSPVDVLVIDQVERPTEN